MAQGTLSVTNNSTAVVGVGTKFTDYAPGSFITLNLVGVPYTIAVDTVTDDTNLVLLVPFDGPTTAGAAFDVTGVNTMALATMGVTVQAQKALRMLLTDQANWRQIFSMEPRITITLPNGQTLTGMSWGHISQQLEDLDLAAIIAARDAAYQARDDAVAAKGDAETAATTATGAATTATGAATTATGAANTASVAAGEATAAAGTAASDAASANADADRAEAAANSVDPSNLLHKDQNLADLGDKAAAWLNVRPIEATPLAADATDDGDAPRWKQVKDFIAAVRTVLASWSVINGDSTAPGNGTTVKGGKVRSEYRVAGAEYAAAELQASVATSSAGVRTVSAEVVVRDSTSGTLASKTIPLGTVDGLTGGTIYGDIISAAGSVNGGHSGIEARNTAADPLGVYFNATMGGYFRGGLAFVNDRDGKYGFATAISFSRNSGITGDHREDGLRINSNGTTWMVSQPTYGSDERLKDNIEDISSTRDELRSLRTVYYDMDGRRQVGLIAQDVQKYWPELIDNFEKVIYSESGEKTEGTYLSLNYTGMIAPTIKAVNENSDAIDMLMDIVKEAITTIAGVTTDEVAKTALEALAKRIPSKDDV